MENIEDNTNACIQAPKNTDKTLIDRNTNLDV